MVLVRIFLWLFWLSACLGHFDPLPFLDDYNATPFDARQLYLSPQARSEQDSFHVKIQKTGFCAGYRQLKTGQVLSHLNHREWPPSRRYNDAQNSTASHIRLLCVVITNENRHEHVRSQASTWGKQCGGFLAFSTVVDPTIPTIKGSYDGSLIESNTFARYASVYKDAYKVMTNWGQEGADSMRKNSSIAKFMRYNFDYMLFCEDRTYVRVPELIRFLNIMDFMRANPPNKPFLKDWPMAQTVPIYVGRRYRRKIFDDDDDDDDDMNRNDANKVKRKFRDFYFNAISGFVLDHVALSSLNARLYRNLTFINNIFDTDHQESNQNFGGYHGLSNDVLTAILLRSVNTTAQDTRDGLYKEIFHHMNPQQLMDLETTNGRDKNNNNDKGEIYNDDSKESPLHWHISHSVDYKSRLDGISRDSVLFGNIDAPQYMKEIHAYLEVCKPFERKTRFPDSIGPVILKEVEFEEYIDWPDAYTEYMAEVNDPCIEVGDIESKPHLKHLCMA